MAQRIKTKYPGVLYRPCKAQGGFQDDTFYIVYILDGKKHEEAVGRRKRDQMTATMANGIRAKRLLGEELPNRTTRNKPAQPEAILFEEEKSPDWTLRALWNSYLEHQGEYSSRRDDTYMFNRYLSRFGDKRPDELVYLDTRRLKMEMENGGSSPASIKYMLSMLRRIVRFGKKAHQIPGLTFELEFPKVPKKIEEDLSHSEIQRLVGVLDECGPGNTAAHLMRIMLYTGRRTGELLKLKWEHVHLEDRYLVILDTKNGDDLKLPLSEEVMKMFLAIPRLSKTWVFPGADGQAIKSVRSGANTIKKRAKLPQHYRATYCLRHTFASIAASMGIPLDHIGRHLGHTQNPKSVTERYARVSQDALREEAGRIADKLNEIAKGPQQGKIAAQIGPSGKIG
ncbi:MAG: site-specific integrase [bacterium]|nr:site-specific integrase [bacterium]